MNALVIAKKVTKHYAKEERQVQFVFCLSVLHLVLQFFLSWEKKTNKKTTTTTTKKNTTRVHTVILLFAFSTVIYALLYSSIAFVKAFNKLKMSSSSTTQAEASISVYSTLYSAYILHKYTSVVELLLS